MNVLLMNSEMIAGIAFIALLVNTERWALRSITLVVKENMAAAGMGIMRSIRIVAPTVHVDTIAKLGLLEVGTIAYITKLGLLKILVPCDIRVQEGNI